MSRRRLLLLCLAVALAGCAVAPLPPLLQSTWYLQVSDKDLAPTVYVAIVNRSAQVQTIKGLIVNPQAGQLETGWRQDFDPAPLNPGGVLVRNLSNFKRDSADSANWPHCQLPVRMVVLLDPGEADLALTGQLPSALPLGWENCSGTPLAPQKPHVRACVQATNHPHCP